MTTEQDFEYLWPTVAQDGYAKAALSRIEAAYREARAQAAPQLAGVNDILKAALEEIAQADFVNNAASDIARQALEEVGG